MKFEINVVVVDDVPLYAKRIEKVLLKRNLFLEHMQYAPIVFKGEGCFLPASEYIRRNAEKINLIFSDYNLGNGGNGIDLFNLFTKLNSKPYRILHSKTSQRLDEHSEEFKLGLFDAFSKSKNESLINDKLIWVEEKIFKLQLFGNPNFYNFYYKDLFFERQDALTKIGEIRLIDIVSINTLDDRHTFVYRKYSNERMTVCEWGITGARYRQNTIAELTEGLPFARVNQSQTVNLLWVSKFELENKKIKLISPDSKPRNLEIHNVSEDRKYTSTYAPYFSITSKNLPAYFL